MAVLTQKQILARIKDGSLGFSPGLDRFQLQSHAVDLRLGFTFLMPKPWRMTPRGREALQMDYFDTKRPDYFDVLELEQGQYFDLLPQEHVLVSTLETLAIGADLMAVMYPRSSTNRKGISVELTGIVDSGYEGQLSIPMRNNTNSQIIRLYPGERFCQIVFEQLDTPVTAKESRYHKKDIIEGVLVAGKTGEKQEVKLVTSGDIKTLKSKYAIKP